MAYTSSAKKAKRVAERRRIFNLRRKKAVQTAVKEVAKLVAAKDAKGAAAKLPVLFKAVDKAAKNHTINHNTADRMKSRISKRIAALSK
jgi:small subunit ribosomal protein S20